MDKTKNYNKGKLGEEIALKLLIDKGYKLVEANYENNLGELDLIMIDKDILIFIEVKLKVGDRYGSPEEMISNIKLRQIRRIAESYLTFNPNMRNKFEKYRIDAVCIVVDEINEVKRITHYENLY